MSLGLLTLPFFSVMFSPPLSSVLCSLFFFLHVVFSPSLSSILCSLLLSPLFYVLNSSFVTLCSLIPSVPHPLLPFFNISALSYSFFLVIFSSFYSFVLCSLLFFISFCISCPLIPSSYVPSSPISFLFSIFTSNLNFSVLKREILR